VCVWVCVCMCAWVCMRVCVLGVCVCVYESVCEHVRKSARGKCHTQKERERAWERKKEGARTCARVCMRAGEMDRESVWQRMRLTGESKEGHDAFMYAPWLMYVCDMTPSFMVACRLFMYIFMYVTWICHGNKNDYLSIMNSLHATTMTYSCMWHVSFMWIFCVRDMTHSCMWNGSYMNVTRLIHVHAMTHSCMCHDSCMYVLWLIHICATTHSCMRHEPFIFHDAHMNESLHIYEWVITHTWDRAHIYEWVIAHSCMCNDSFMYAPWNLVPRPIPICGMTDARAHIPSVRSNVFDLARASLHEKGQNILPWLIHVCATTHLFVCHDSFMGIPSDLARVRLREKGPLEVTYRILLLLFFGVWT